MTRVYSSSQRFIDWVRDTLIEAYEECGMTKTADDFREALVWLDAFQDRVGVLTVGDESWLEPGVMVRFTDESTGAKIGDRGRITSISDSHISIEVNRISGNYLAKLSGHDREAFAEHIAPALRPL